MFFISEIQMYARFVFGLRGYFDAPIDLAKSHRIIRERMENREQNMLGFMKRAIYENEHSPYLKLLKFIDCEYQDFAQLVMSDGIEVATIYTSRVST